MILKKSRSELQCKLQKLWPAVHASITKLSEQLNQCWRTRSFSFTYFTNIYMNVLPSIMFKDFAWIGEETISELWSWTILAVRHVGKVLQARWSAGSKGDYSIQISTSKFQEMPADTRQKGIPHPQQASCFELISPVEPSATSFSAIWASLRPFSPVRVQSDKTRCRIHWDVIVKWNVTCVAGVERGEGGRKRARKRGLGSPSDLWSGIFCVCRHHCHGNSSRIAL